MHQIELFDSMSTGYLIDKLRGVKLLLEQGFEVKLTVDERFYELIRHSVEYWELDGTLLLASTPARVPCLPTNRDSASQLVVQSELPSYLARNGFCQLTTSGNLQPSFEQYLFPREEVVSNYRQQLTGLAVDCLPNPLFIFTSYQKAKSDQGLTESSKLEIALKETCSIDFIFAIVKAAFEGSRFTPIIVNMQYGDVAQFDRDAVRLRCSSYFVEIERLSGLDLNDGSFEDQAAVLVAARELWETQQIPSIELGIGSTLGHLGYATGGLNGHVWLQDSSEWSATTAIDGRIQWQEIAGSFPGRAQVVKQIIPGDWSTVTAQASNILRRMATSFPVFVEDWLSEKLIEPVE